MWRQEIGEDIFCIKVGSRYQIAFWHERVILPHFHGGEAWRACAYCGKYIYYLLQAADKSASSQKVPTSYTSLTVVLKNSEIE